MIVVRRTHDYGIYPNEPLIKTHIRFFEDDDIVGLQAYVDNNEHDKFEFEKL